jgi:cell division protein FtsQ
MLDSEKFVSSAQIWHQLNTKKLIHKKINLLEIDSLETLFKKNPFIAEASLSVDLSGMLNVKIAQKHPFVMVTNSVGQRFFIDRQGNKMPFSRADVSGHIAEGLGKADTIKTPILKNILYLSNFIETSPFKRNEYRFFEISDQDQMRLLPAKQSFIVLLGDTSHLDEKFLKLDLMYSTVFPREGLNKYSTIDLQYTDQVVCTLKPVAESNNKLINYQGRALALMPSVNKQNKLIPH